jgi:hypothetical protein
MGYSVLFNLNEESPDKALFAKIGVEFNMEVYPRPDKTIYICHGES